MNKSIFIISILLLISGLILTACSSDSAIGSSIKITNPIKKCRMVSVPYQVTEEYDVDLKYEVVENYKTTTLKGFDVWAVGVVKVRNVDSETGTFTVIQTFKTLKDGEKSFRSKQYVMPGETKEFREDYDISLGEDFSMQYSVIPGTKKMTRQVTKYREEEKCD